MEASAKCQSCMQHSQRRSGPACNAVATPTGQPAQPPPNPTHRADCLHKGGLLRQADQEVDHGDEEGVAGEVVLLGALHLLRDGRIGKNGRLNQWRRVGAGRGDGEAAGRAKHVDIGVEGSETNQRQ